ncbi:hypothetical protein GCM10009114_26190 [Aliiglaciecola litoralis]|uniref:Transposase n=1 Tax=Aliiglaciecola litoralis TaxID=582857 RepID=A0ABN1LMX7_9ALTE
MRPNKNKVNGYYWVKCGDIDSEPVIAELYEDEWFFCGFQKAYLSEDITILSEKIEMCKPQYDS